MIEIDDNFECGAVEGVRFLSGNLIQFRAPLEGSPQSLWFAFRIRNAKGRPLRFEQTHVDQCLGWRGYGATLPVFREGPSGEWRRLSTATEWDPELCRFRFTLTPQTDETYVAFTYPYGTGDLTRFLQPFRSHPLLSVETLGRTGEGRELPTLLLGGDKSNEGRSLCVFVARQHAGETPGSYVLEGVIEAYLSAIPLGEWCRGRLTILAVPMVDLDGVVEGRYGKDRPPRDFNRDWCAFPLHREISAIMQRIEALASQFNYQMFVDLHAPGPGDASFWLPARPSHLRGHSEAAWRLGHLLEELAPGNAPVRLQDYPVSALNWSQELYLQTAITAQCLQYGILAGTLEISYHRHRGGEYLTPEGWRGMGRALLESIAREMQDERPLSMTDPFGGIERQQLLLEGWHIVTLPQDALLKVASPTSLQIIPHSDENALWVTCEHPFTVEELHQRSVRFDFESEVEQGAEIEVIAYGFKGEMAIGWWSHQYLEPGISTYHWRLPEMKDECIDSVRMSLRISHLTTRLDVEIGLG